MSRPLGQGEMVDALAATDMFSSMDRPSLARLSAAGTQHRYGRGHYLFHRGDRGDSLLVVARGSVKVTISSADGAEVVLTTVGRSESLGELAVLDGAPRSASVVAIEPTVVLVLGRRELLAVMGQHPDVLDAVLVSLGALVRRLTETAGDLVFLDLGGRLAKALLRLAEGGDAGGPITLDLGLTQSDIAAMVGASRQAANRALHLLASQGWITIDGSVIVLRDIEALRRRAGL